MAGFAAQDHVQDLFSRIDHRMRRNVVWLCRTPYRYFLRPRTFRKRCARPGRRPATYHITGRTAGQRRPKVPTGQPLTSLAERTRCHPSVASPLRPAPRFAWLPCDRQTTGSGTFHSTPHCLIPIHISDTHFVESCIACFRACERGWKKISTRLWQVT
jgi:hypothetical protein